MESVPAQGERRQHELHAVQVQRRVAQIARQVRTGNPFRVRGHPHVIPQHRAERMRAVPANIRGGLPPVPRVKPGVVRAALTAQVAVSHFGMVHLHPRIRLPHHNARAAVAQLPHCIRMDQG